MAIHARAGDTLIGKIVVYEASKVTGPSLITKSGRHRGLRGKLYNANALIGNIVHGLHVSVLQGNGVQFSVCFAPEDYRWSSCIMFLI